MIDNANVDSPLLMYDDESSELIDLLNDYEKSIQKEEKQQQKSSQNSQPAKKNIN